MADISTSHAKAAKEPLDIDEVFRRLRRAVAGLPKAAMFELRDRGHGSPFEQLIGSLISARARDETTVKICLRLFAVAHPPKQTAARAGAKSGKGARRGSAWK